MHNGCILYGDVGVGKTITSLAYYFEKVCGGQINKWGSMETPRDIYVITTAKVRDSKGFELQAAQFGVFEDRAVSTNGVKITVDSWNNLHKYVEVQDAFFVFDEQRVVGYGAWSRAFIKIARANPWILLSATPGDTWMDYIPVFIANGWYKHKTDFVDQHVIWTPRVKYPKVLRYQNVGVLVRRRNEVLVRMPYERHTKRHAIDIWCDYDETKFERAVKKRWHVFEERPLRDVAELFIVMRKVVNSDSSRLEHVRGLLRAHPKLIVFYNFDYELEMLRQLAPPDQLASPESIEQAGRTATTSESTTASSMSTTPHTSCAVESNCPGHWTVDRGNGEAFLTCQEFRSAMKNSTTSSRATSTSPSPPSSETGLTSTSTAFAVAEWNGHKHEEIPKTDSWVYLVQYRAGAEGWNCIETDAICFFSQTYSYRDWFQAHGRIDRLNTPFTDLYYYHLVSRSVIDKAIRAALKVKKNFNERDLVLK